MEEPVPKNITHFTIITFIVFIVLLIVERQFKMEIIWVKHVQHYNEK
jgi:hypothetical protein